MKHWQLLRRTVISSKHFF